MTNNNKPPATIDILGTELSQRLPHWLDLRERNRETLGKLRGAIRAKHRQKFLRERRARRSGGVAIASDAAPITHADGVLKQMNVEMKEIEAAAHRLGLPHRIVRDKTGRIVGDQIIDGKRTFRDAANVNQRTGTTKKEFTMVARRKHDDDDDSPFDANGILKDGRSVRFPVTMADAWQEDMIQSLHQKRGQVIDGAGSRPGYRIAKPKTTDSASRAANQARYDKILDEALERRRTTQPVMYSTYEKEMSEMWKHPVGLADANPPGDQQVPPIGFSSGDLVGKQVGDTCTLKGSDDVGVFGIRGHIQKVCGKLVCVADRSSASADDAARHKKTQRFDPQGRSEGYWEEEEEGGDDDTGRRDARSVNDRSAVEAAYEEYDRSLSERWRNP